MQFPAKQVFPHFSERAIDLVDIINERVTRLMPQNADKNHLHFIHLHSMSRDEMNEMSRFYDSYGFKTTITPMWGNESCTVVDVSWTAKSILETNRELKIIDGVMFPVVSSLSRLAIATSHLKAAFAIPGLTDLDREELALLAQVFKKEYQ